MAKNKFCVFCGEKPKDKNKEHIIPKWLIKMTGNPTRDILVGLNKDDSLRTFSINKFTLPACEKCNTEFSELEATTKPIMESILTNKEINSFQMSLLLDWFDKVRIGLWLMYFILDKNKADVLPKFHIKQRIGQYDRMLHISRTNSTEKRINFLGVENFSFQTTPSIFGLVINNCAFINMSFEGLTSRRMGYPFFVKKYYVLKENQYIIRVDLDEVGLKRVITPIIRKKFLLKGYSYYQTVYNDGLIQSESDFLKLYKENDYVTKNTLEAGKSKIISSYSNGRFFDTCENLKIPKNNLYENMYDMRMDSLKQVFELHIWLDESNLKIPFENTKKEAQKALLQKLKYSIIESKHKLKLCNKNKVIM